MYLISLLARQGSSFLFSVFFVVVPMMLLSINNQSFVVKLCDQVRFVLLQAEPFSLLFFFSLLIVSLLFLDALCYGSSVLK
jgi:hypothetical protein